MSLSISGLVPNLPDPIGPRPDRTADALRPPLQGPAGGEPQRIDDPARGEPTVEGVDPQLWGLLSTEERVFYLRSAMTGPATYGPDATSGTAASPGHRLGGRLDVRI